MDENVVKHLEAEDYDIVMFYDYNSLETDFVPGDYVEKYLVAWSMGVMVASIFNFETVSATAINGTLKPIDAGFGINPGIYELTIRRFNEKGREKFIQNMFETPYNLEILRDLENQKSELEALKTYNANPDFKYNRIIISDNDKIIPTKNQEAFWSMKANIKSGHCPFFLFNKWSELL